MELFDCLNLDYCASRGRMLGKEIPLVHPENKALAYRYFTGCLHGLGSYLRRR